MTYALPSMARSRSLASLRDPGGGGDAVRTSVSPGHCPPGVGALCTTETQGRTDTKGPLGQWLGSSLASFGSHSKLAASGASSQQAAPQQVFPMYISWGLGIPALHCPQARSPPKPTKVTHRPLLTQTRLFGEVCNTANRQHRPGKSPSSEFSQIETSLGPAFLS